LKNGQCRETNAGLANRFVELRVDDRRPFGVGGEEWKSDRLESATVNASGFVPGNFPESAVFIDPADQAVFSAADE